MGITKISIRNFRSLQGVDLDARDLNVFVGQNDEGKSNVLRALDLFFNSERRGGYEFVWAFDYCSATSKKKRKAEEIVISLDVSPPPNFKNQKAVRWTKVWRKEGLHSDLVVHVDGTEVGHTSKIAPFLRTIRYDYVPAIKSGDYFQALMGKLYDMLEATVEEQVRAASGTFTQTINSNTERILQEIEERLGLATTIELPKNLNLFFRQLEFTSAASDKSFSLNQRGDGVKVRHIPIVLRWLAERANFLSAPGKPKAITIWGYEEPENNLELRKCFDLAREFVETSSRIQTFITTHSPAFYSVFNDSGEASVALFHVRKDGATSVTEVDPIGEEGLAELDSAMGLLELLEPHFKAAAQDIQNLRSRLQELTDNSVATIFCEGPSDELVLKESLRLFYSNLMEKVAIKSTGEGGGHRWVMESCIAWSYSRPTARCVGLFDTDAAALKSLTEANERTHKPDSGRMSFVEKVQANAALIQCAQRGFKVPFAYEELLPSDVWEHAESRGWIEPRAGVVALYGFNQLSITFDEYAKDRLQQEHLKRIALNKVKLLKKMKLARYVVNQSSVDEKKRILKDVNASLTKCLVKLRVLEEG